MKPKNTELQKRRKRDAVIGIVSFSVLTLLMAVGFWGLCQIPNLPSWLWYLFMGFAILHVVLIIPGLFLLKQRFREIEGGELDEASQY